MSPDELKAFFRELVEESLALSPVEIAPRWQGGHLVLNPGNDSQSKEIPIEVFFKKLLTVRDALRVLEQKINSHPQLAPEEKLNMQGYITKAYGTLTTFNILFKDGKDRFVGSGGSDKKTSANAPKMTLTEAQKKLGLNEY